MYSIKKENSKLSFDDIYIIEYFSILLGIVYFHKMPCSSENLFYLLANRNHARNMSAYDEAFSQFPCFLKFRCTQII